MARLRRNRMSVKMRDFGEVHYGMILTTTEIARARQRRAAGRAKSRQVFENSMERRRIEGAAIAVRARLAPETTFVASDEPTNMIERREEAEPRVHTLWRGLERALAPDSDSVVLRDLLNLACRWGFLPTGKELAEAAR